MREKLQENYGFLFEDKLIDEIVECGKLKVIKAGDIIIDLGQKIEMMPIMISGVIKVMREDDDGDELVLYYLERGDTCAMTMTCCLGNTKSEIRAIAEIDSEIVVVPTNKMDDWMVKYPSWRSYVFESYNSRLSEMLEAIDSLAFMNMDERLSKYLSDKVKVLGSTEIETSHQDIAYDLNSSRVVISRLLKKMEKDGKLKIKRNRIEVMEF